MLTPPQLREKLAHTLGQIAGENARPVQNNARITTLWQQFDRLARQLVLDELTGMILLKIEDEKPKSPAATHISNQ